MTEESKDSFIESVTFSNLGGGRWTRPINLDFQPDMAVLKQVVFSSGNASILPYYIWCSLINDYIAVLHNTTTAVVEPMITVPIYSWPTEISFRLDYNLGGGFVPSGIYAFWSISFDFSRK